LEHELNKIIIPTKYFNLEHEIAKNTIYIKQVMKIIDCYIATTQPDNLILQDERPNVMSDPHIKERGESIAPFYISLKIHEHILHN
jgi:hypothetical protein